MRTRRGSRVSQNASDSNNVVASDHASVNDTELINIDDHDDASNSYDRHDVRGDSCRPDEQVVIVGAQSTVIQVNNSESYPGHLSHDQAIRYPPPSPSCVQQRDSRSVTYLFVPPAAAENHLPQTTTTNSNYSHINQFQSEPSTSSDHLANSYFRDDNISDIDPTTTNVVGGSGGHRPLTQPDHQAFVNEPTASALPPQLSAVQHQDLSEPKTSKLTPIANSSRSIPEETKPVKRKLTKSIFKPRLTIESPVFGLGDQPQYEHRALNGLAEQIESFPCLECDRIFLTAFGLEKHTREKHAEALDATLASIHSIKTEWKRRETMQANSRKMYELSKFRHDSVLNSALRHITASTQSALSAGKSPVYRVTASGNVVLMGEENYEEQLIEPSNPPDMQHNDHDQLDPSSSKEGEADQPASFTSCRVCQLVINQSHPTALASHMKAHQQNDQLRKRLLATKGERFVSMVTCFECKLVFTDTDLLKAHADSRHRRKRTYVCKCCGETFMSLSVLNSHKLLVHGLRGVNQALETKLAEAGQRKNKKANPKQDNGSVRTSCEVCGLIMIKPSLLIKHMNRVHRLQQFSALFQSHMLPNFKAHVDDGKVSWECCAEMFASRKQLLDHRKLHELYVKQTEQQRHNIQNRVTQHNHNNNNIVFYDMEDNSDRDYEPLHNIYDQQTMDGMCDNGESNNEPDTVTLTPEQLHKLGLTLHQAQNMILIDDGSGALTAYDREQWRQEQTNIEQHDPVNTDSILHSALTAAAVPTASANVSLANTSYADLMPIDDLDEECMQ